MKNAQPLSALLSQVLVAFVIEFDNEFEHQVPHCTTNHGATGEPKRVPWLVSMPLWLRFLRFVPHDGITISELQRATGFSKPQMKIWLTRASKWWGYLSVAPEGLVLPTAGGAKAFAVWNGLNEVIEKRWAERFDRDFEYLRRSLQRVSPALTAKSMDSSEGLRPDPLTPPLEIKSSDRSDMLPILLGNVLFAFKTRYDEDTGLPLALSANILRVLEGERGVRVSDVPELTGLSKEAVAVLSKLAEKRGYVQMRPEGRRRLIERTPAGSRACVTYLGATTEIEKQWRSKLSESAVTELRNSLERLAVPTNGREPAIFRALDGYPAGWRATLPARKVLPHYPMISHRGGLPDGS